MGLWLVALRTVVLCTESPDVFVSVSRHDGCSSVEEEICEDVVGVFSLLTVWWSSRARTMQKKQIIQRSVAVAVAIASIFLYCSKI